MNTWIILRTIVHPATQHKPRSIAFVASVKCEVSKWRCIQNSVANNERRNKKEKRRGGEGEGRGGESETRKTYTERRKEKEKRKKKFFLSFRQEVCLKVLKLSGCADCLCRVRNGGRTVARIVVEKTRNMVYNRYPSIRDGIFLFLFAFHFARLPLQSFCRRRKRAPTCTTRYRDRMQGRNGLEIDQRFFSSRVCLRTFESA